MLQLLAILSPEPAPRRLAHFVRLTPSGCVSKAKKAFCLCAARRLAHFVRLTPSGGVSKAKKQLSLCSSEISSLRSLDSDWVRIQSPLKNNVSRDFLLLYAIAVTQASLRPAPRRLAHFVRLTPSGCLLKAL